MTSSGIAPINDHFSGPSVCRRREKTYIIGEGFLPQVFFTSRMCGLHLDPIGYHSHQQGNLGAEGKRGDVIGVCGGMGCAHVKLVRFPTDLVATTATEARTSGQMPYG